MELLYGISTAYAIETEYVKLPSWHLSPLKPWRQEQWPGRTHSPPFMQGGLQIAAWYDS